MLRSEIANLRQINMASNCEAGDRSERIKAWISLELVSSRETFQMFLLDSELTNVSLEALKIT